MSAIHETGLLEWGLRGFSLSWTVPAGYAIQQARGARFMDDVLEALEGRGLARRITLKIPVPTSGAGAISKGRKV